MWDMIGWDVMGYSRITWDVMGDHEIQRVLQPQIMDLEAEKNHWPGACPHSTFLKALSGSTEKLTSQSSYHSKIQTPSRPGYASSTKSGVFMFNTWGTGSYYSII